MVDDADAVALGSQQLRGVERDLDHRSGRHETKIAALRETDRLADGKFRILGRDVLAGNADHADVHRSVDLCGGKDRLFCLGGVAGGEDRHVRNAAHEIDVLHRLVASAVLADVQTVVREHKFDVGIHIRHSVADRLVRTSRAEERKGVDKRHQPAMRHARRRADHVRLGNAEIIKPVGIYVLELRGFCQIRVQNDQLVVFLSKLDQRFRIGSSQ